MPIKFIPLCGKPNALQLYYMFFFYAYLNSAALYIVIRIHHKHQDINFYECKQAIILRYLRWLTLSDTSLYTSHSVSPGNYTFHACIHSISLENTFNGRTILFLRLVNVEGLEFSFRPGEQARCFFHIKVQRQNFFFQ